MRFVIILDLQVYSLIIHLEVYMMKMYGMQLSIRIAF